LAGAAVDADASNFETAALGVVAALALARDDVLESRVPCGR
jgi:hypothetical protein